MPKEWSITFAVTAGTFIYNVFTKKAWLNDTSISADCIEPLVWRWKTRNEILDRTSIFCRCTSMFCKFDTISCESNESPIDNLQFCGNKKKWREGESHTTEFFCVRNHSHLLAPFRSSIAFIVSCLSRGYAPVKYDNRWS
jgi:hypothetical protein